MGLRESWMHIEIGRVGRRRGHRRDRGVAAEGPPRRARVGRGLGEDADPGARDRRRARHRPPPLSTTEIEQGQELLRWLANDHFTFLGYREYRLESDGEDELLRAVPGTGLGILRSDQDMSTSFGKLPAPVKAKAREKTLLVLAKANSRATVHRPAYLDYVGVKKFDDNGDVVGERRILGLYSSAAYTESLTRIPLLREKATEVLRRIGFDPRSHAGKALMDTLETYPRDELFQTPVDELAPMAEAVMHARERRQVRMFLRRDTYGRYVSVLVYLPRDRYSTSVREKFGAILKEELGGESIEFSARVGESTTANVHFVVHPPQGKRITDVDQGDLERRLTEASRSWRDDFLSAALLEYGEDAGSRLARRYVDSFPEAYKEDYLPATGCLRPRSSGGASARRMASTSRSTSRWTPPAARRGSRCSGSARRSRCRRSCRCSRRWASRWSTNGPTSWRGSADRRSSTSSAFATARSCRRRRGSSSRTRCVAVWDGFNEIDGFNALVLDAGLTWRQATVLRAYAKYMKQGNSPFALDYMENALRHNVELTRLLVQLFTARFDPGKNGAGGRRRGAHLADRGGRGEDRARPRRGGEPRPRPDPAFLPDAHQGHAAHQLLPAGRQTTGHTPTSRFKLEPSAIPDLPQPRPRYEIFVYSPRVEGVHLRFGAVARGGLRWSDRRDDFRTEVLGLVKAQMVKNTVIVPVGAKGGFFCKQLPDPANRDAWLEEGVACYKTFISGLLDITDNLVDGEHVAPTRVVRHDGGDSYLVVAADKGTATFSDIANGVAKDYGFWLGDAFASGGSVGYDHKAMGITARGAWVSVQRHFRERGIDCQAEDFTAVGIGDMSGDVFGNGMLCSEHTRLVAAFDHRDIFLDPDPDAAKSYAERRRLFEHAEVQLAGLRHRPDLRGRRRLLPLAEVDHASTSHIRKALGIEDEITSMTPAELMKAILQAPVDLLWNGGIGTYVKARLGDPRRRR